MRFLRAIAAAALFVAVTAPAQQAERKSALLPETVLDSAARHFPAVIAALAARRGAIAGTLEAEGAFDLVFEADGFGRASGFYDGVAGSVVARQPLRPFGADLYAGYKISEGDFPIYEDENFTNTGGAVKVGLLFSLLRDRDVDERRIGIDNADIDLRRAELDVLLTRIGVQRRALVAYWRWVAAGRQVDVYQNLLDIALQRQQALERQVERGARARIFLTENMQNITRRRSLLTSATRDLQQAANTLSLYYQDARGEPRLPTTDELPESDPADALAAGMLPSATDIAPALQRRPELGLLQATIERERNRIALAENSLKPRLDFKVEVQEGLGAVGEGGVSRDSTDTIVGLTFSVPLQRRSERGRLERSRAALEGREAERRLKIDQIAVEIRELLLDLDVSRQLFQLAIQEADLSGTMREAEVRRFESGASDFFLVNVREETEANARIRLIGAALDIRVARANYDAATVDVARLGITPALLPGQ